MGDILGCAGHMVSSAAQKQRRTACKGGGVAVFPWRPLHFGPGAVVRWPLP